MAPAPARRVAQPGAAMTATMAGAVDLAAVKARSEAAARAAEAPAPGQFVVDVTEQTFQAEVLDRSFQVPVLIDLWADWCQPCKQLSPILEKLANEGGGSWVLAKIDTEANPRIAQALQVQSIPTVYAVLGGQLVPGFQGALPEPQVREFVVAVLDAGREAGLANGAGPAQQGDDRQPEDEQPVPEDPRFDAAEAALADGDYALAEQRFRAILDADPGNADAALAVRQVALLARVAAVDPAAGQLADAKPDDVTANLAAADLAMVGDDAEGALRRLLDLLPRVSGDERDSVRQRLLDYFDLLGPADARVPPARKEMARALF